MGFEYKGASPSFTLFTGRLELIFVLRKVTGKISSRN